MKPRRILIFSLVYYPRFIGGAEVAMKEITDRISPDEAEFDMITLRLDKKLPRFEKIGNVNVYRVGWCANLKTTSNSLPWYLNLSKYFFLINGTWKALLLHRTRKYDAIWSLMATYNTFAALFFKLLRPQVKFIFTLQDGDPISYLKRRALPLYPFFKMFFTRADHIQTISKYLADWAKEMGAKCPITIIPNAVDYNLFATRLDSKRVEELRREIGKKEGDIFLITTSRLVVKNAVGDIIEALRYLPNNVKLLILGQGYEEEHLKAQAAKLEIDTAITSSANLSTNEFVKNRVPSEFVKAQVSSGSVEEANQLTGVTNKTKELVSNSRVQFLGYIPHSEMPKYLQISDVFIRPSLSEGLGISFLEAMAAGIPIIATPVGGIPDFLKDGETGLFCEVRNPKSIAQKVDKLIKDKESREYIVKQAREMVKRDYGWESVTKRMKDIFVEV